jgi:hypothetical protein
VPRTTTTTLQIGECPVTSDLDFRRSDFAGHRNIFLCSKAVSSPQPICFNNQWQAHWRSDVWRMSFPLRLQPRQTTWLNHFSLLFMIKRERPRAIRLAWARALTAEAVRPRSSAMSEREALEMTSCRSRSSSAELHALELFIRFVAISPVMLVSGPSTPQACLSLLQLWQRAYR